MLPLILKDILLGGDKCGCPSCSKKTATRKVVLSGEALAAVIEGNAAAQAHAAKIKDLMAELDASKRQMWTVIQKATGTEGIDDLSLDLDHIDVGIAVLKISVKHDADKPDDTSAAAGGNKDGGNLEEAFRNAPDPVPAAA